MVAARNPDAATVDRCSQEGGIVGHGHPLRCEPIDGHDGECEFNPDDDSALVKWDRLRDELLARGGGRLEIAMRAARVAALGGEGVVRKYNDDLAPLSREEEDEIVAWAGNLIDELFRRGGLDAMTAAWYVALDWFPGTIHEKSLAIEKTPGPSDVEWVTHAPEYPAAWQDHVRVLLAGAVPSDLDEIRRAFRARGVALDEFVPFTNRRYEDVDPRETFEDAIRHFATARTNADLANAVGEFVHSTYGKAHELRMSPGYQLGLVAWLAHRGLKKPRVLKAVQEAVSP